MVSSAYDSRSVDDIYIMTMASFYEAAGGTGYVGLSQSMLNNLELSDTIRLNHAVLVGHVNKAPTALSVNGELVTPDDSRTIVRILLPVDRRPSEGRAKTREELEDEQGK